MKWASMCIIVPNTKEPMYLYAVWAAQQAGMRHCD